jgi:hypothetical protein
MSGNTLTSFNISCWGYVTKNSDVLKLRYEWKHIDFLNKRNHAAGITSQVISIIFMLLKQNKKDVKICSTLLIII